MDETSKLTFWICLLSYLIEFDCWKVFIENHARSFKHARFSVNIEQTLERRLGSYTILIELVQKRVARTARPLLELDRERIVEFGILGC